MQELHQEQYELLQKQKMFLNVLFHIESRQQSWGYPILE